MKIWVALDLRGGLPAPCSCMLSVSALRAKFLLEPAKRVAAKLTLGFREEAVREVTRRTRVACMFFGGKIILAAVVVVEDGADTQRSKGASDEGAISSSALIAFTSSSSPCFCVKAYEAHSAFRTHTGVCVSLSMPLVQTQKSLLPLFTRLKVVERDLLLQEKEKLYKEMKDILARQVSCSPPRQTRFTCSYKNTTIRHDGPG